MYLTVIISTYNQPEWLNKVLHGYLLQQHREFELIVADDGSDEPTFTVIDNFRAKAKFALKHVWHEHLGYRRQIILNEALRQASHDYIVMTDGDCVPRPDFLSIHANQACPGYLLSGGYCKLPMDLSLKLTLDDIASGRAFDPLFLKSGGLREFSALLKLKLSPAFAALADAITPTKATWNNCNSSGWKKDIFAVNGFNEDMQYGGADRELGERLANLGIKSRQLRHRAVVLHLDHKRGYKTPETMAKNRRIREELRASKRAWCDNGLMKQRS
jgi:glycosyltransferase involved in cell wall biosynthesis